MGINLFLGVREENKGRGTTTATFFKEVRKEGIEYKGREKEKENEGGRGWMKFVYKEGEV